MKTVAIVVCLLGSSIILSCQSLNDPKQSAMKVPQQDSSQGVGQNEIFNILAISPDKDKIALVSRAHPEDFRREVPDLWIIDISTHRLERLTHFKDPDGDQGINSPLWSPDGKWIAFQ